MSNPKTTNGRRLLVPIIATTSLLLAGAGPTGIASSLAGTGAATASTGATRLSWFYGEPTDGTPVPTIASRHKLMILSGHQSEDGYIGQLRNAGYTGPIVGYVEFPRTMGTTNCAGDSSYAGFTTSWTSWDGDFCTYLNPNEGYFLHNSSGARLRTADTGWYYLNPASAGLRQYMVNKAHRYFSEFPGLSGIFLDDLWATAATARNAGCAEAICHDDASWHSAVLSTLQAIRQQLAADGHSAWANTDDIAQAGYAGSLDGWMWEDLGTGWCDGCWESQGSIEQHLADADAQLAAGKSVLFIGQGDTRASLQQMRFSHALYLMVAGANSFYRFQNAGDYRSLWDYPEYGWDLGAPLGPRFKPVATVFQRTFSNGAALANMGTSSVTINLGGSYILPDGSSATSVTLAAHQGVALRR